MDATPAPEPVAPVALAQRLRETHLEMVDAVLSGEGLGRVAEIAAEAAGGSVAIVLPRAGQVAVAPPAEELGVRLGELRRYVGDRLRDHPTRVPVEVFCEAPIGSGEETLGAVLMLDEPAASPELAAELMHLAAVACLTDVAIQEARDEVESNLRGSLLENLRERPDLETDELVRRAHRLGCDLNRGMVALCAELATERPRHVVATVLGEHPGALVEHMDGRVYALLPGTALGPPGEVAQHTLAAARRLAERLQRQGTVGLSSFYSEPAEAARAIQEAELVLDVLRQSDVPIDQDIGDGAYRLLFRVLASHPEEVRSFYESTVAPVVAYDAQYRTDLMGTLDAYLRHNCSVRATAAAIYAHRHTISYRLDRVRELTGLDATQSEDRERLGLGLKAHRIIAPRLPK